jgi:hypothetical protein
VEPTLASAVAGAYAERGDRLVDPVPGLPCTSVELAATRIARGQATFGLYRSRTSRVRLTYRLGKDQDQARSSVVWFRLLYLIVVCVFRWLAVVVCSKSGPPRKPNSRAHPRRTN